MPPWKQAETKPPVEKENEQNDQIEVKEGEVTEKKLTKKQPTIAAYSLL
jgi:hypothetical protein